MKTPKIKNLFNINETLSITEKLDYWKSIIDKHFNEPLTQQFGEYQFTEEQEQAKRKQLIKLFGINYRLVTPLFIPEHTYNKHFKNGLSEPEFTYWFLKYNAQNYFDTIIFLKLFPEKLKTSLAETFIKAELNELNEFEQKAENLLLEKKIDPYNNYSYSEYAKEIEYLRIKAGYYKTHVLPSIQSDNKTVYLYAEHVLLKEFLNKELNKTQPENKTEGEQKQIQFTFINNFNNNEPTDIYDHFKAGLVDKKYLTEQELQKYLKAAFELKTIPETLFKIKNAPNKGTIEAVFYTYYKDVAGKIHGKQKEYAALLGNYFEGYKTTTVSSNFSKSVY